MIRFLSFYHPKLPVYLVYMLQQVEYNPHKFVDWLFKVPNLTKVMHRQTLVMTLKARLLVVILSIVWAFYAGISIWYLFTDFWGGVLAAFLSPFMTMVLAYLLVLFGWLYIEEPRRSSLIKNASKLFKSNNATKIAILGSYGKTTMKELLLTILSEGKKVAATPGNKNVPVSHAKWVKKLNGEEEILLIEFGEGAPGDVKKLAQLTHPDRAIITGLAPNHLDEYKTLKHLAADLLTIRNFVPTKNIYINTGADSFNGYDIGDLTQFNHENVSGWKVSDVKVSFEGTKFKMTKGTNVIKADSKLLGRHQVGPLALAAAIAADLGLSVKQVESGIAKTTPFEHRMQPRLQHGAQIIDDTYNGSIEGLRAGLGLLTDLKAKRKIYVTPGLVDQGEETERVHLQLGTLIAEAAPDRTVLMQNSTTQYIVKGLEAASYRGELQIQSDPLAYYTNLEHVLANGDLIMLQNDWTDNYS